MYSKTQFALEKLYKRKQFGFIILRIEHLSSLTPNNTDTTEQQLISQDAFFLSSSKQEPFQKRGNQPNKTKTYKNTTQIQPGVYIGNTLPVDLWHQPFTIAESFRPLYLNPWCPSW